MFSSILLNRITVRKSLKLKHYFIFYRIYLLKDVFNSFGEKVTPNKLVGTWFYFLDIFLRVLKLCAIMQIFQSKPIYYKKERKFGKRLLDFFMPTSYTNQLAFLPQLL